IKGLTTVKSIEKTTYKDCEIPFSWNSSNHQDIKVDISGTASPFKENGIYRLDTIQPLYNLVVDPNTGNRTKEIRQLEMHFKREGYWQTLKKGREGQTYYHKGKKMKLKV